MKKKSTAMVKRTLKTNPKGVATPKYQHTGNITISGVGESEDGALFLKVAVGEKRGDLGILDHGKRHDLATHFPLCRDSHEHAKIDVGSVGAVGR